MKIAYRRAVRIAIMCLAALWTQPSQAADHLVCVLVPHFKDEYWLSVADGIEKRAARTGLHARFFEAGGYGALANQIGQIAQCSALHPRAMLIGTVSSDDPALLAAVAEAARHHPVIGLVNELHSDVLAARIGVDWQDMGAALGAHLRRLYPAGSAPQSAILLSGPPEAGWVAPLETGLRQGLQGSSIHIRAVYAADTGTGEQLRLLERALAETAEPDLIIGPAPAIEAAMAVFSGSSDRPALVATYISHSVARGLVGGKALAAPFDDPIRQGELALEAALSPTDPKDANRLIGPAITVIQSGADPALIRLSPADYFPALD